MIELHGCDPAILKNRKRVRAILLEGARRAKATIITDFFHCFSPYGVSGVVVIAESHVSIHTWPEFDYAALDVFTCQPTLDLGAMRKFWKQAFAATSISSRTIPRGVFLATDEHG